MAELLPVTRKFDLPTKATADSIAEMVRALLSQKAVVRKMVFTAEPPGVVVDMLVPDREPPYGEVETDDPTDIWGTFQGVDLEEVREGGAKFNKEALALLTEMLVRASKKKLAGVALVAGSVVEFMRWVGVEVREDRVPTMFWNMPLIQFSGFPEDKLVLLCAKSSRLSALKAEAGFMVQMYKEARDVGPRE